jgi:hypothetical protein
MIPPSRTLASGRSRSSSRGRHRPGQEGVTTPRSWSPSLWQNPLAAALRRRQPDNREAPFPGPLLQGRRDSNSESPVLETNGFLVGDVVEWFATHAEAEQFIAEVASAPNPEDAVLANALSVVEADFAQPAARSLS